MLKCLCTEENIFFFSVDYYSLEVEPVKKPKGFTLIELLVVVAIIGIIATVLVSYGPQYIQNAKQKGSMKDISALATACANYAAISGEAPASGIQEGILTPGNAFIMAVSPEHMPVCPIKDKWGNPLMVYTGVKTARIGGFTPEMVGKEDFIIISYGRDGVEEGFVYEPYDPEKGYFEIVTMADYGKDLINWNANWIRGPLVK
jgi:prepilin-type N-terminal cleavage/methylation domain-containing protein